MDAKDGLLEHLDKVQNILKDSSTINTDNWKQFEDESLEISGKSPPEYRVSDYYKRKENSDVLLFTTLSPEQEKQIFEENPQKPGSEPLSPLQYGITIDKYSNPNELAIDEWFAEKYKSIFEIPVLLHKKFTRESEIKYEDKEIYYYYDDSGPDIALYATLKLNNTSNIFFFRTYIRRNTQELNSEIIKFKTLVESTSQI